MAARVLFVVLVLGLCVGPGVALAEKVKTNQTTKLFARPGERAKVILNLKEGQGMTVLAKQGRWIKVRVSGRTGYVAQSTVLMAERGEIPRNTRRRSFVDGRGTKRGFGGEQGPDDRVGADALGEGQDKDDEASEDDDEPADDPPSKGKQADKPAKRPDKAAKGGDDEDDPEISDEGDEEPSDDEGDGEEEVDDRPTARVGSKTDVFAEPDGDSDVEFIAKPSMILFPTGNKKGKFTEIENEEGDIGYVLSSRLEVEDDAGGDRRRHIDLTARGGVVYVTQNLQTPNAPEGVPNNYGIVTPAAALAVGGSYLRPYKARMMIGGELAYEYAKAIPGVQHDPDADGPMKPTLTAIGIHNLNLRGAIGYDLRTKRGMMVFGRAGVRYHSYQVPDVSVLTKNTATLPSEIIISPTVGGVLTMPKLTPKVGLRFSLDIMPLAFKYTQTKNLEDGARPSAKGAVFGAGFTYRQWKDMDIQASYDLNYSSMSFGAKVDNSQRNHPGGSVTRRDLIHSLMVGINKPL